VRAREPRAPGASKGVHLLASRPMRDPVRGVVDKAMPMGQRRGAPRALELGAYLLMLGSWLAPKAEREPRTGFRLLLIGSLRLGRALEP
jgi:hypothetical protein